VKTLGHKEHNFCCYDALAQIQKKTLSWKKPSSREPEEGQVEKGRTYESRVL